VVTWATATTELDSKAADNPNVILLLIIFCIVNLKAKVSSGYYDCIKAALRNKEKEA